ncbi:MAG: hypothetical protein FWF97_03065 [Alphaproteobacteria bacterium]|nr:hypothetical protein [Alphaproteobacteria bacterium]
MKKLFLVLICLLTLCSCRASDDFAKSLTTININRAQPKENKTKPCKEENCADAETKTKKVPVVDSVGTNIVDFLNYEILPEELTL